MTIPLILGYKTMWASIRGHSNTVLPFFRRPLWPVKAGSSPSNFFNEWEPPGTPEGESVSPASTRFARTLLELSGGDIGGKRGEFGEVAVEGSSMDET